MNFFSIISAAESAAESTAESIAETVAESAASMVPEDFVFDYAMRVPILSMILMAISLVLIIAVPVYLLVRMKNRFKFEIYALTFGLLAYMLGVGVIPTVLELLLSQIPSFNSFITANPTIADLLHVALLIVFSFAGILFFLRFALRRSESAFAGAAYFGIAVGLLPILTQGTSYLMSYLSAALSINQGQLASSVSNMINEAMDPAEIQAGLDSMAAFIETPSYEFLFFGTDLIFQMATFLGVSLLLGLFIKAKAKTSLFKAFGVQALFCAFFAIRATGIISNNIICELTYLVVAVVAIVAALSELNTYLPLELKKFFGKPDPKRQSGSKNNPPHKMPKIVMPKD